MNNPPTPRFQTCVTLSNDSADWEPDYKDVYELDTACQQAVIPLATRGFREAGYDVRQAEKAPYHPVYIFKLKRLTAPRFVHERDLLHHVRGILAGVGLSVPKDASGADRNGDRIVVSFMWEPDAVQKGKSRALGACVWVDEAVRDQDRPNPWRLWRA